MLGCIIRLPFCFAENQGNHTVQGCNGVFHFIRLKQTLKWLPLFLINIVYYNYLTVSVQECISMPLVFMGTTIVIQLYLSSCYDRF